MKNKLSVFTVPDAIAVSDSTILQAALYFDEIYVNSFYPILRGRDSETHALEYEIKPAPLTPILSSLQDAGVVKRLSTDQLFKGKVFPVDLSSRKLPLSIRREIAESLEGGADFLTSFFLSSLGSELEKKITLPLPYCFSIEDPSSLENSKFELAICTHLTTIFGMLELGLSKSLTPLCGRKAHVATLMALAKEFPKVAKALRMENASSLLHKQNVFAQRILEDTLPEVRVKHPEDILYLRDELNDELQAFRTEVARLSTELSSSPWEQTMEEEMQRLIATNVKPAIMELRRRLGKPSKRLLKHLVSDWEAIAGSATVPITAIVMTNAQLPWALLAGVSAGLSIAALKAKVEEWSIKAESTFTFLIEAGARLEK